MSWTKVFGSMACLLIALSAAAFAQEGGRIDEPSRWNPTFVYGATAFGDSDAHRTFGASFRFRVSDRLNLEPEFRYMYVPSATLTTAEFRRESSHSDTLLAGNLVYDFRDESKTRFVPYVSVGAGWGRSTSASAYTELVVEGRVPVFPAQPAPFSDSRRTSRTSDDWLWLGAGVGVRIMLPHGFFVSPEVRLGGTSSQEIVGSAAIKLGYGF